MLRHHPVIVVLGMTAAISDSAMLLAQLRQEPAPCLSNPVAARPYTRLKLLDVVRDQTPPRAEYLIRTCGVRVPFDKDLESDLREAGASEGLVNIVRKVAPPKASSVKDIGAVISGTSKGISDTNSHDAAAGRAGDLRKNSKDGLVYVFIPPGTFLMGCKEEPCEPAEKPAHQVRISKGFWLGQTEVTTEAYKRYTAAVGRAMPVEPKIAERLLNPGWEFGSLPMTMVTWEEAVAYCAWAGNLRLPTEAEWEYAARAGTTTATYAPLDDAAWYAHNSGNQLIDAYSILTTAGQSEYLRRMAQNGNRPHPVAQKAMNAFRLYDMLGNVWEWVADWYTDQYESDALQVDPKGSPTGQRKGLRGGAWFVNRNIVRASYRGRNLPSARLYVGGFRCAGEVGQP